MRYSVFVALLCIAGNAQSDEDTRESLRGMEGVIVIVDGDEAHRESIKILAEDRLQQAGVRLLSTPEWDESLGGQFLYIQLSTLLEPECSIVAYSIRVELIQGVLLFRDQEMVEVATTWGENVLGVTGQGELLRRLKRETTYLVDGFADDFRFVNP